MLPQSPWGTYRHRLVGTSLVIIPESEHHRGLTRSMVSRMMFRALAQGVRHKSPSSPLTLAGLPLGRKPLGLEQAPQGQAALVAVQSPRRDPD